jgi:hypothetical protein
MGRNAAARSKTSFRSAAEGRVPGAPGFRDQQIAALVAFGVPSSVAATIAGEILWNAGTRGGVKSVGDHIWRHACAGR